MLAIRPCISWTRAAKPSVAVAFLSGGVKAQKDLLYRSQGESDLLPSLRREQPADWQSTGRRCVMGAATKTTTSAYRRVSLSPQKF